MKRRDFLAASAVAGAAGLTRTTAAQEAPAGKQYLELRLYSVSSEAQRARLDEFLAKVMVPALNRVGVSPVGVFQFQPEEGKEKNLNLYVLLPHPTVESLATMTARLVADKKFWKEGKDFLYVPKKEPLYDRVESSMFLAFDEAPKVVAPKKVPTRIFQLRIYEAHSIERGQMKIQMFNAGREIQLFREAGMQPVFFGEALVGSKIPNLTYMVTFPDEEAKKANWDKFVKGEGWNKLKKDPIYKDTVSNITNLMLLPTDASQI